MDIFQQYATKIQRIVAMDIEATVRAPDGEIKKVWICEGYATAGAWDGILTLYREGDEVRTGVAQGLRIVDLHPEPCQCAACTCRELKFPSQ